jgi:hypothetical protein
MSRKKGWLAPDPSSGLSVDREVEEARKVLPAQTPATRQTADTSNAYTHLRVELFRSDITRESF